MRISRDFSFSAGHTIWGHKGKCAQFHGHNYKVTLVVESSDLDDLDMVMDFGFLKQLWSQIDSIYDHKFLIWDQDPRFPQLFATDSKSIVVTQGRPTAEFLSKSIFDQMEELIYASTDELQAGRPGNFDSLRRIHMARVTVQETEDCSATYP